MESRASRVEQLLPLLVFIQTHLDADLSLASLAREAALSPTYLQRLFRSAVGESPKAYVDRLRLERAALSLMLEDCTVLDCALAAGFRNHETFTRAFGRRFGVTPSVYRRRSARARGLSHANRKAGWEEHCDGFSLSKLVVRAFRPMHVAFLRHVGPYESVPAGSWQRLQEITKIREPILLGIGHDSPSVTPPEKLRFDACIVVGDHFPRRRGVALQTLPGCTCATATHVGPYATLPEAWAKLFAGVAALRSYSVDGPPVIEIYRSMRIRPRHRVNETELCVPVKRLR